MSRLRAFLDASPISQIALAFMREATGRTEPLAAIAPTRPAALRRGRRVGFWSLSAGAGSSTVAALLAHRSAAGGEPPLLVDLDRWVPSLALRAGLTAANVADALLQPGREAELVSRWSAIPFLPGAPSLHATFDGERLVGLINSCAAGRSARPRLRRRFPRFGDPFVPRSALPRRGNAVRTASGRLLRGAASRA